MTLYALDDLKASTSLTAFDPVNAPDPLLNDAIVSASPAAVDGRTLRVDVLAAVTKFPENNDDQVLPQSPRERFAASLLCLPLKFGQLGIENTICVTKTMQRLVSARTADDFLYVAKELYEGQVRLLEKHLALMLMSFKMDRDTGF
jgi:hypothetical protein